MKNCIILSALTLFTFSELYAQTDLTPVSPAPVAAPGQPTEIFRSVEVMPEAPYSFRDYLIKNISYPAKAMEADIQGTVYVSFVVERDGGISTVKAVGKILEGGLTEEAIRVVRAMPKWKPGMHKGSPVRCYFTVPITFRLEDDVPAVKNTDTVVYRSLQVMPKSSYDFLQYIRQNIKYPEAAKSERIEAKILVTFIVEKDGRISNATVTRGKESGNGFPEEALRVITSMPPWEPGKNPKGEPVRCYFTVPINFKLQ